MCNTACILFGLKHLTEKVVTGRRLLEVGSIDINGSLRWNMEPLKPASYLGIDKVPGNGVDYLCSVEFIVEAFGKNSFDIVICTEVLEHVYDWRLAITNLKLVCTVGGKILVTTRSKGFPYHEYPNDFWRFEVDDMKYIFSDCIDVEVESDPTISLGKPFPGVFVCATRTERTLDLQNYNVSEAPKEQTQESL